MRTVLKIALGLVLGGVLLIGGCVALLGAGVNEVQEESDRAAITQEQYAAIGRDDTRDEVEQRLGPPQDAQDMDQELPPEAREFIREGEEDLQCIYYNKEGELASLYQFCFDGNGRFESKASY